MDFRPLRARAGSYLYFNNLYLLLYIVLTICLLIGWKPTVNSEKQRNPQIIH